MNHLFRPVLVVILAGGVLHGAALLAASEPPATPAPAEEEVCVLETSMGTMVFRLFEDAAPATVRNFKALVREGFYDGLPFYRVVAGHVIQAGDGGENGRPTVKGEFGAHAHVTGALGLARSEDPDSGSTEIYVCHAPRPHLDGRYAVFGLLVEGFEVLEAIGNVAVEERFEGEVAFHEPLEPVVIERAYLERRPAAGD
jgi:cyclophilin family peptidyl-prolyl cis-trans isomerase